MPKKITNTKLSNVVNIKIGSPEAPKPKRRRGKKGAGKKKAVINTRDLLTVGGLTSTPGINANTGQVGYQLADYIPPLFDQRPEIADTPKEGDVDVNTVTTKTKRPPVKTEPAGSPYGGKVFDKEIETISPALQKQRALYESYSPRAFSENQYSNMSAAKSLFETPRQVQPMRGGGGENPYQPFPSMYDLAPGPPSKYFQQSGTSANRAYEYPEAVKSIIEKYSPRSSVKQEYSPRNSPYEKAEFKD